MLSETLGSGGGDRHTCEAFRHSPPSRASLIAHCVEDVYYAVENDGREAWRRPDGAPGAVDLGEGGDRHPAAVTAERDRHRGVRGVLNEDVGRGASGHA